MVDGNSYSLEKSLALHRKAGLKAFYLDAYREFQKELALHGISDSITEIGAGTDLIKTVVPTAKVTDVIDFPGRDFALDCSLMPFGDNSQSAFFMLNVLHHVPNKEEFFNEAVRCLRPGGILFIRDQYLSPMSRIVYKYFHAEDFDATVTDWNIVSSDPVKDANGAIPHLIFYRDRRNFEARWPDLKIKKCQPCSSVFYWLSGGLKSWSLVPAKFKDSLLAIDKQLTRSTSVFASFMDVVIQKENR